MCRSSSGKTLQQRCVEALKKTDIPMHRHVLQGTGKKGFYGDVSCCRILPPSLSLSLSLFLFTSNNVVYTRSVYVETS